METASQKYKVAVVKAKEARYPTQAPYHPSVAYPEYPFTGCVSQDENFAYESVRQLFFCLGYDKDHWNSSLWNPLGSIAEPGMTVVIKPNFVLSRHYEGKDIFSVITHPSILRAIADYCWIALKGRGRVIIADAPQHDCNFQELLGVTKLTEVRDFLNGFQGPDVEIRDLRNYYSKSRLHFPSQRQELPGDPRGSIKMNLGEGSAFLTHKNPDKFYGAVYDRKETITHHTGNRQEYEISRTILDADVLISVPKLKVHKKVGVTLNFKGLVGTCTNKNLIIHYTLGLPSQGGDQFPEGILTRKEKAVIKFERWMYDNFLAKHSVFREMIHRFIYGFWYLRVFSRLGFAIPEEKRILDAGNWYGNDSAWRMVADLAKIIYFADGGGKICSTPKRRLFSLVDGIMGGENKGPLVPDPKPAGILLAGENMLAVDMAGTRLMGFDWKKLKQFTGLDSRFKFGPESLEEIEIASNSEEIKREFPNLNNRLLSFRPHPGWIDHIEL